jgi:hypothetical protein
MGPTKLKERLAAILRDMKPWDCGGYPFMAPPVPLLPEDERDLPPFSVFLSLVVFSKFPNVGRGEKVAWSIPIRYKGVAYLLEHQKFGFRIRAGEPDFTSPSLERELIRCLRNAVQMSDGLIKPFAQEQMRLGNVTVGNRYGLFRGMYQFLRDRATKAFAAPQSPPQNSAGEATLIASDTTSEANGTVQVNELRDSVSTTLNHYFTSRREGFFLAAAALDAYFAHLEHTLVLLLPFVHFDPAHEDLAGFITSNWSSKFKRLFDLRKDHPTQDLFKSLLGLKEKFRNSVFHGGFDKDGLTLYFHVPILGAIPMSLSRNAEVINYSLYPIDPASFEQVCDTLDSVDTLMDNGPLRLAMNYVRAGLDVPFDEASRKAYARAMSSEESMEEFINQTCYIHDMNANMDW